jgi:hypothetical protein
MSARMTRRYALQSLAVLASAGVHGGAVAAAATKPWTDDAMERYLRIRTAPDGAPVMWLHEGVLLAKLDGDVAKPLLRVNGLAFTRAIRREAGVYDWQLDEVGYYRDLKTGAVLEQWTNPFTGQVIRPNHYRTPESMRFVHGQVEPDKPLAPGVELHGEIETLAELAGLVVVSESLYVRIGARPAADGKPARQERVLTSLGSYAALAQDLERDASAWVDCQLSYSTMNSFAPWLGMEQFRGIQNLRLAGRKCRHDDRGEIPTWFRERIERDHPTFLDLPKTWLRS